MKNIVSQLIEKFALKDDFNPFLNKFYWEPDMHYIGVGLRETLYNEAFLVIDQGEGYSDVPYILEADSMKLAVLIEYNATCPVHKMNRISITSFMGEINPQKQHTALSELICDHIKPQRIFTFSSEVGDFIKDNFDIELRHNLSGTDCWKGFVKFKDKYFYLYCLPDITQGLPRELDMFIMATGVYDFQVCEHINAIMKDDRNFKFPEKPLVDKNVKKYFLNAHDGSFFPLASIRWESIAALAKSMKDFDAYDVIASMRIEKVSPSSGEDSPLDSYTHRRTWRDSKELCLQYIDQHRLQYHLESLELSLIRLFLFLNYPVQSFNLHWNNDLKLIESLKSDYEMSNKKLEEFQNQGIK